MGKIIDLTGKRFARWTVLGLSHQVGSMLYWHCVCDCGTKRAVFGADLKRGGSVSCGCFAREKREQDITHGMTKHPAYRSWIGMKMRCENPKTSGYDLYGGRGIRVCEEWRNSFETFWRDMGPTWAKGLTIERIDVNQGYGPSNCRWATWKEQAGNRRTERLIETPEGKMSVTKAAELFGIDRKIVFMRIIYGWPENRLLMPPRERTPNGRA